MFRLTEYMHQIVKPTPARKRGKVDSIKPVVIWNLTRRCNLRCRHCYTVSADVDFPGELSTQQVMEILDDLERFKIPALILSGGEPLYRQDIFEISSRARSMVRMLALSTNGTKVLGESADKIAEIGFDYVGISIDGNKHTNDWFRGHEGAYDMSIQGVRNCKNRNIKVGLRFTLTEDNHAQLPDILQLCEDEGVDKFYLSHLVYSGRGDKHRFEDARRNRSRWAMDLLIDHSWQSICGGRNLDIVTGNNDADAVYFLNWVRFNFEDDIVQHVSEHLKAWGGNSSGLGVANIDPIGNVHPDTYWSDYTIGNVKNEPFSAIWQGSDPMLAQLRTRPRPLKGRCGACNQKDICGGNTRIRALQLTGDPWEEDPACYLDDEEIGLYGGNYSRLEVTPFKGKSNDPEHKFC